ncbi:T9SS type A sorting domain-containing protein, partial [Arthrospira platensis SPKY2]
ELFIGFNGVIDYVRVYNLQGQQVLNANNMNSVDVSSLTPGMYMVTVGSQNQQITKKFIKK